MYAQSISRCMLCLKLHMARDFRPFSQVEGGNAAAASLSSVSDFSRFYLGRPCRKLRICTVVEVRSLPLHGKGWVFPCFSSVFCLPADAGGCNGAAFRIVESWNMRLKSIEVVVSPLTASTCLKLVLPTSFGKPFWNRVWLG